MKLNNILQSSAFMGLFSIITSPLYTQNIDKGKALNADTMTLKTKVKTTVQFFGKMDADMQLVNTSMPETGVASSRTRLATNASRV